MHFIAFSILVIGIGRYDDCNIGIGIGYRPIWKSEISVVIGIGQYEKWLIGHYLSDSISEEKLKLDWKKEKSTSWSILVQAACGPNYRSSIFHSILNFSSEMESGNISPPLIACKLQNSKILKNLITLVYNPQFL